MASRKFRAFIEWAKWIWVDILTMLAIGGVTLGVYLSPNLDLRRFPTYYPPTPGSGSDPAAVSPPLEVVYPHLAYPYRPPGWLIPSWIAGLLSVGLPLLSILLAQIRLRSLWDATNAILGTLYAVLLAATAHVFLKTLIGGFRPYFLSVCDPLLPSPLSPSSSSSSSDGADAAVRGSGFGHLFYTTSICQTDDKALLKQAMTSFPSGHAAVAFAGLGFLSLYLNGKLKAWGNRRTRAWVVLVVVAPVVCAGLIACSVLVDNAHHAQDVVVGIGIGVLACFGTYRMYYAAIWDWRFNHVPLRPGKDFEYDLQEAKFEDILIKRSGWWGGGLGDTNPDGDAGRRRRTPVGDQMV